MTKNSTMTCNPALEEHTRRKQGFGQDIVKLEKRSNLLSLARLISFLLGAVLLAQGIMADRIWSSVSGAMCFLSFGLIVVFHWRVLSSLDNAQIRKRISERHLQRITDQWKDFACRGQGLFEAQHPYAVDIDLFGVGSVFQRISVAHTQKGQQALAHWLSKAADAETIARRQRAVKELAERVEFRQELEAAALPQAEKERLDASAFHELAKTEALFKTRFWLKVLICLLPLSMPILYVLTTVQMLPKYAWLVVLPLNVVLLYFYRGQVRRTLDLAAARYGVVEAFEKMLLLVEACEFKSERLVELKKQLCIGDIPPSKHLRRLRFWVGFAELRQQPLLHVFVNPLLLWDLHVLRGLERWVQNVGQHSHVWFDILGEFEALASLATLAYGDPNTSYPDIVTPPAPFQAENLAHPLLPPTSRVANDLSLEPASVLMITGSNMAGKSTLLRTVGVNIALALAGGPVCAKRMRLPLVELRTSMRVDDSLQQGASYFYAELQKLHRVIQDTETSYPVFFLLDELLRGTNEQARQVGGLAVLDHLLSRNTMGLVATHHFGFVEIENRHPGRVAQMHFTDSMVDGQMRFDYRLRPGVVQTSNALQLLRKIGIDVSEEGCSS